jgi:hypothetical protein
MKDGLKRRRSQNLFVRSRCDNTTRLEKEQSRSNTTVRNHKTDESNQSRCYGGSGRDGRSQSKHALGKLDINP